MTSFDERWDRLGIVRIRRHLGWGLHHGWFRWSPYWLRNAIVTTWNFVSCHTVGHDISGPFYEPPDEEGRMLRVEGFRPGYYPKTCTSCGKRWPESGDGESMSKGER